MSRCRCVTDEFVGICPPDNIWRMKTISFQHSRHIHADEDGTKKWRNLRREVNVWKCAIRIFRLIKNNNNPAHVKWMAATTWTHQFRIGFQPRQHTFFVGYAMETRKLILIKIKIIIRCKRSTNQPTNPLVPWSFVKRWCAVQILYDRCNLQTKTQITHTLAHSLITHTPPHVAICADEIENKTHTKWKNHISRPCSITVLCWCRRYRMDFGRCTVISFTSTTPNYKI